MLFLFGLLATGMAQTCKSPTPVNRVEQKLTVDGISRKYQLFVPENVQYPTSLVVAWHGITSSPDDIEPRMKLTAQAQKHGFVLVFPEAKNVGSGTLLNPVAFNGAACCKNDNSFNDVAFFHALKAALAADGCVDTTRVFSMGYSNGSFMTHRIACEDSNAMAAGGLHSGTWGDYDGVVANSPWAVCDKKNPTPMIGIMGTADATVPFLGGPNPSPFGRARWGSFYDQMNIWATQNSCGPGTSEQYTESGRTLNQTTFGECGVDFTAIEGLGHEWWPSATERFIDHFLKYGL